MKSNLLLILTVSTLIGAQSGDLRLRDTRPPLPRSLKIEQIQPALEQTCVRAITRAIQRNVNRGETIANYFREIGNVFSSIQTNGNFSAEYVTGTIERIPSPLTTEDLDPYVIAVRTLIVTLYKLSYEDRMMAEKSPVEWLAEVSTLFRNAINTGLLNTGHVGLK